MISRGLVPPALVALTALTVLAVVLDVGPPVQPVVVALFLVTAPGAALLLGVRSWPPLVWATAVVAASLTVDVLLSTALLHLRWWSPTVVLACLSTGCVAGALPHVLRARRPGRARP